MMHVFPDGPLRSLAQVWRAEGVAAVRDRLWDRAADAARRASCVRVRAGAGGWPAVPVLNVIGVPMAATFGGVPLQLRARLRREAAGRPVALLSREADGSLRLECHAGGRRYAASFPVRGGVRRRELIDDPIHDPIDGPSNGPSNGPSAGRDRSVWNGDPLIEDPTWLDAVRACCDWLGVRAIHVENAAGLSLVSLAALARLAQDGGPPLLLSVHDFSLFCRRPHLWDARGGFCGYSTDADRCGACLAAAADGFTIDRAAHVRIGRDILHAAARTIFPSTFLRDQTAALFETQIASPGHASPHDQLMRQLASGGAGADEDRQRVRPAAAASRVTPAPSLASADVIPPGIELPPRRPPQHPPRDSPHDPPQDLLSRPWPLSRLTGRPLLPQIALLGGGQAYKGGARFPRLASALAARGAAVTHYGGYGHDCLRALRAPRQLPDMAERVHVRGYYRAGSLPALLARQGAAVAVLLPGVPESFSLALSEAWAAGVPVVAPAIGALAERLREGGGLLVSPDPSDAELIDAIERLLAAPPETLPVPPTAEEAANRHLALYRECGLLTSE